MNRTENYNLSQWELTDKVQMSDFNADNAKLDAALKAASDAREALSAALDKKGNCTIGLFSYTGTGEYGISSPTRVTFPRMPAAFIIFGPSASLTGRGGQDWALIDSSGISNGYTYTVSISLTWSGTSFTCYSKNAAKHQMNDPGVYTVIAFYAES